ncbi:hypothetical protein ILUMI_19360, partial [Ignelater luminosus]
NPGLRLTNDKELKKPGRGTYAEYSTTVDDVEIRSNCYLENAIYTTTFLGSLYTAIICLARENQYKAAATKLHEIVDQFDTYAYTNPAEKVSRQYAIGYTAYIFVGFVQYNTSPFFDYSSCLQRDNTHTALACGLPTPGSFLFNSRKSPDYEVAFVFQSVCSFLCIMLKMIKDNLQEICNSKAEKRNLLRDCVKHHIASIELCDEVATPLNEFLLVHAVLLAVILTVIGFQIIRMLLTTVIIWNLVRYLLVLLGFFVILAVMSAMGQMLIDESLEVAESAYNTVWYDESLEFQQMIQLIILRSHKPLVLRSATVSELSFSNFAKVMSSTYSYLTLLYNTVLATEDN